ncbi:hypothetical protein SAMN05518672_1019 [Chitinophaga sp. CF118]|nr:hypothetical protein SAMN05518672_1019 [Chitinophaga sp. CF118]
MAFGWFVFNGNNSCDGPTDPANYCLIKIMPDCICGNEICAIYAEINIVCCKMRPCITSQLQTEITIAKLTGKPSSNVLLKNC